MFYVQYNIPKTPHIYYRYGTTGHVIIVTCPWTFGKADVKKSFKLNGFMYKKEDNSAY